MQLKAGTINDFNASMAQAMDQAFNQILNVDFGGSGPSSGEDQRKLLFVAIAQGVVEHLKANAQAFQVEVDLTGTNAGEGNVTEIL